MKKIILALMVSALINCNYVFADVSTDIEVKKTPLQLNSKFAKSYSAYNVKIVNQSSKKIDVLRLDIDNSIYGQQAYYNTARNTLDRVGYSLGGGLVLALPTGGLSILVSLVSIPVICIHNGSVNSKMKNESLSFVSQFQGGELMPNDSMQFNILLPINQTPQIKLTALDLEKNEKFILNR